jgi:tRNA(Ile2) C34 agmatinyltransferase TiaS
MTAALLDRPGSLFADAADRGQAAVAYGGVTLEELLNSALCAARTNGSTECPVCRARMTSARAGAECGGCGSRLS